jgi:hypothetical protein
LYDELIREAYNLCGPTVDDLRLSHAWVQKWPAELCEISPCPSVSWEGPDLISQEGDWVDDGHWATEAFQAMIQPRRVYTMSPSGKSYVLSAHILGLSIVEPSSLVEHQPWGIPSPKSASKLDSMLGHSNIIADHLYAILIVAGSIVAIAIFVAMYFIRARSSSAMSKYELATNAAVPKLLV